ncbi:ABC-three component system protein [Clostridium butyricum]|uniref:ABC-three component systems C-terminal domain-containing protein n=1 Tax=Clostridium butyricum E4 str. BoNT E BL5262 TaxID=632245 RepID=C4IE39_CLOBU|nr:ABC-three component system protein [Clostridium butyricum]EDT73934.1 conserved hypothetical protein [Clostridium butyricum 5521]EEP55671.1 conserved hypothetical protein [Clostridium butyricum E4 str. BoNT E BL5262]NFL31985.1 restriction endonuclease [Clostridium butyricum]NFS18757.1 restriction endonuclease [Clostridium butyricum]
MIETSLQIKLINDVEPIQDPSVFETVIPPIERVKSFSPDQFEEFILEWVISCAKTKYKDVYRIGGAGDMGRDVIGEYTNGEYDYYQCKRYEGKLNPSEYWVEFGKLCYYTYNKDIPMPKKYYIIASQGLGPKMINLIKDEDEIRKGLITNWDTKCKNKITKSKAIELNSELRDYINKFDFKIVDTCSINKIIEQHRQTNYFYFRFGGVNRPTRSDKMEVPKDIDTKEFLYVKKIFKAYSENKGEDINIKNLTNYSDLNLDFNRHRRYFYSAESLKHCIRDIFIKEDEFNKLKYEMYSGIIDFIEEEFKDGYVRLKKTMFEATRVNLSVSIVDRDLHFISNDDKKGLCHEIANDDTSENIIDWSNN